MIPIGIRGQIILLGENLTIPNVRIDLYSRSVEGEEEQKPLREKRSSYFPRIDASFANILEASARSSSLSELMFRSRFSMFSSGDGINDLSSRSKISAFMLLPLSTAE